ncbi:LutC/YkgG family protein [Aliarcobacter butzleri]|uniref:LUD domain-containing protein n=1 Tax=Aliarcobacter butzleri TaxID=28197 RepID=A0AAW7PSQ2_9BACT|nr:LUD domain-containing protein [Aliarcobacter butzleri]MDN5064232.1 LUD domain-containing protein [Aliarcobacter butzleri]MDN5065406.1 LUD domain-containing protein [Aliarcobacter butzleri]
MTSKEKILNSIRENNIVKDVKLPSYENFGIKFDNKFETFSTMLESVGGKALVIEKEDLDKTIKELYPDEKVIASNVDFCNLGNFDSNSQDDAHNLKDIDLAIVKGNFAVAENGAIWMKDASNRHRSLYFIAQNIVIVINENEIVNNMHEAYEKLSFEKAGFGVFISGPSKTADIEQSLVIGAHGPKSGYVIFIKS